MAEARYNDAELLSVFGVHPRAIANVFFETPTGQRFLAERDRKTERATAIKYILTLLRDQFGHLPKTLVARVRAIKEQEKLDKLHSYAAKCTDLKSFQANMDEN